jgi:WD40 repeat protein
MVFSPRSICVVLGFAVAAPLAAQEFTGGPLPPRALLRLGSPRFTCDSVVRAAAFSRDGKLLAVGTQGYGITRPTVFLYDLETGAEVRRLLGHYGEIVAVAFGSDGKTVYSAAWDNTIRFWDVATGKETKQLKHEGVIEGMVLTPDGASLISCSQDGTIRRWDAQTGKELGRYTGLKGMPRPLAVSPDGKTLACGAGSIFLWDLETGKELRRIGDGDTHGFQSVVFSPDGKKLAAVDGRWKASVWDVAKGEMLHALPDYRGPVWALAFSPDGKTLVAGGGQMYENHRRVNIIELRLWDAATGKQTKNLDDRHTQPVRTAVFSLDGKILVTGGEDWGVRLWDTATWEELPRFKGHSGAITRLAYSPDGRTLVTASRDSTLRLWDPRTGAERRRLVGHEKDVASFDFAQDGKSLVSLSRDNTIRVWDAETGTEVRRWKHQHEWPSSLAVSPDGKTVATGAGSNSREGDCLCLWDFATGKLRHHLDDQGSVQCVAFAPDGVTLASGGGHSVFLWIVSTGKIRRQFPHAHSGFVTAVGFAPDGTLTTLGTVESHLQVGIRFWNPTTKEQLHQLATRDNLYDFNALAYSPDGRYLAVSFARTIHVWESVTRQEVARFEGHTSYINSLAFSPDGRVLASGARDGSALLWDLTCRIKDGRLTASALTPADLDALWRDLAGDAAKAHAALWKFVAAPEQALPYLRERLPVAVAPEAKRMAKLLAELNDDDFTTREKASEELERLLEFAAPELEKLVENPASVEASRRAAAVLKKRDQMTTARLRARRAVQALEYTGGPEGEKQLDALARGAEQAEQTRESRAALQRLRRRSLP